MSFISIGLMIVGVVLMAQGATNPRERGYEGTNKGGEVDVVRHPVSFDRGISNYSPKNRDQQHYESLTTFSDGRRYYT